MKDLIKHKYGNINISQDPSGDVWILQDRSNILVHPDSLPALIASLQSKLSDNVTSRPSDADTHNMNA